MADGDRELLADGDAPADALPDADCVPGLVPDADDDRLWEPVREPVAERVDEAVAVYVLLAEEDREKVADADWEAAPEELADPDGVPGLESDADADRL